MVNPNYASIQEEVVIQIIRIVAISSKKKCVAMRSFRVDNILGTADIVGCIVNLENVVSIHPIVFEQNVIDVNFLRGIRGRSARNLLGIESQRVFCLQNITYSRKKVVF